MKVDIINNENNMSGEQKIMNEINEVLKKEGITGNNEIITDYTYLAIGDYIKGKLINVYNDGEHSVGVFETSEGNKAIILSAQLQRQFDRGLIELNDNLLIYRINNGTTKNGRKFKRYKVYKY